MSARRSNLEVAALPSPGTGDLLFLAGITQDGHLQFTDPISASAWRPFLDIETEAGDIGSIVDADIGVAGGGPIEPRLLTFAVDTSGGLQFTYLTGGGWRSFIDVKALAGNPGDFVKVAVGEMNGLEVCGITSDGLLWHATRTPNGTIGGAWVPFFDVTSQAGDRTIVQAACAGVGGDVHLCAVSDDGHLWITTRPGGVGPWTPFADIERRAGERGFFIDVDCAVVADELHVCGVTNDGRIWHTIRRARWTPFEDLTVSASNPGKFLRVGAGGGRVLQVAGVTSDGRLWQADRLSSGKWNPFASVEATAGQVGDFADVALHGHFIVS